MLRYTEIGLSRMEVPGEASLCVYLSGCQNHCSDCHYPELSDPSYGALLEPVFDAILDLYLGQASCLCLLGEGYAGEPERAELVSCAKMAHSRGMLAALYSGRDCDVEPWMEVFDYVKLGRYRTDCGPLSLATTNQRMLWHRDDGWIDITKRFWREVARFRVDEIMALDAGMLAICGRVVDGRIYHGDVIEIPTASGQCFSYWVLHFGGIFFYGGEFRYVERGDNVALIVCGVEVPRVCPSAGDVVVLEGMRPAWNDALAWEGGFGVPSWARATVAELGVRSRPCQRTAGSPPDCEGNV